jgi:flavorubredoxin
METVIDEIAPDIFRLSAWTDQIAPPAGFTFNQFLVRGQEPFLFHTGMRDLFPLVSGAVNRVVPLADLRWISFAHVEADECGAMNLFLDAAPQAQVAHGELACMLSLDDMAETSSTPRASPRPSCRHSKRSPTSSPRPWP